MTKFKQQSVKAINLDFAPDAKVTSFGGIAPIMRLMSRMGVTSSLRRLMPKRLGSYSFSGVISASIVGLLSGAFGTATTLSLREDPALLDLAGLKGGAPTEATFWRVLGNLGGEAKAPRPVSLFSEHYDLAFGEALVAATTTVVLTAEMPLSPALAKPLNPATKTTVSPSLNLVVRVPVALAALEAVTLKAAARMIAASPKMALFDRGFVPVFIDGSLLEGSQRREGSKAIPKKGEGLLYTAAFVGPYPVLGELASEGTGETSALRRLLPRVMSEVVGKTGLRDKALVLADSLHGNGPTLDVVEKQRVAYIIGANALEASKSVLKKQPESQWRETPDYDKARGVDDSAVCTASIQCEGWEKPRTLVGRRWKRKGEIFWNFAAVMTNLTSEDPRVQAIMKEKGVNFAEAIWLLYNRKGACENHFKNLLTDLGMHHPPCQAWGRNAAYFAIGLLSGLLAVGVDVLGNPPGKNRQRLSTLRRWLFAAPARITRSGRTITATILGLSEKWRSDIEEIFNRLARC